jgi:hypothetical protein
LQSVENEAHSDSHLSESKKIEVCNSLHPESL